MLSKIRKLLLIPKRVRRITFAYQAQQKKRKHHKDWELIMSGLAVRDVKTEKSEHKTQATVSDEGILVEYMDGRFVNQRHVNPLFIDSINWGGMK